MFLTKTPKSEWDYGYELHLNLDAGALKFHIHDDSDDFCFARLLVCPEIRTIYITDMFAYTLFHIEGYKEYHYFHAMFTQPLFATVLIDIILTHNPDFEHVKFYTTEAYAADLAAFKDKLASQLVPLTKLFPSFFVPMVGRSLLPSWVRYVATPVKPSLKEVLAFPTDQDELYSASMAFFN